MMKQLFLQDETLVSLNKNKVKQKEAFTEHP